MSVDPEYDYADSISELNVAKDTIDELCYRIAELEAAEKQYNEYMKKGIDIFMSPCEEHSGTNTQPFYVFLDKYGSKCLICMVDENKELHARIAELEAAHQLTRDVCSHCMGREKDACARNEERAVI